MKELFILSCWPNSVKRENLLINLISQLKSMNKDVMIASHHVIPAHIAKMADYCIYDKENTIYTSKTLDTYPADFFYHSDKFDVDGIAINHSAALSRIFNISINFAKNLDYDYFAILESDVEFNYDDLKKFDQIKLDLTRQNKKFFFFKLRPYEFPYWENNGIYEIYESCYFGGMIKEFSSVLNFPKTLQEWDNALKSDKNNHNLEYVITNAFKSHKSDCLILDSVRNIFTNSKINTFTVNGLEGVYYNEKDEYHPILFLYNQSKKRRTYKFISWQNQETKEIELENRMWWFCGIDAKNKSSDIKIEIYEEDGLVDILSAKVDENWLSLQKNRRKITFK